MVNGCFIEVFSHGSWPVRGIKFDNYSSSAQDKGLRIQSLRALFLILSTCIFIGVILIPACSASYSEPCVPVLGYFRAELRALIASCYVYKHQANVFTPKGQRTSALLSSWPLPGVALSHPPRGPEMQRTTGLWRELLGELCFICSG